jgi:hypothetical protein
MTRFSIIFIVGLLCAGSASASNHDRAVRLQRILKREHSRVSAGEIESVLDQIDVNLRRYFPHGPFTKEDFVSLAMTESRFDRRCVGTSGERGVFQVMPEYHHAGDLASTRVNTRMAFLILRQKYREHHDRRRAIIAYNGYVVHNGRLRDAYWMAFIKQRNRVGGSV